jgi:hypothetical protein
MPTECNPELFDFVPVGRRAVVAWFDGGAITSDDSGFAREMLMAWCEENGVDFIFGLPKNIRLNRAIGAELAAAWEESRTTGEPARRFKELIWSTRKSWSRQRRVIAKAEWTRGGANPRYRHLA